MKTLLVLTVVIALNGLETGSQYGDEITINSYGKNIERICKGIESPEKFQKTNDATVIRKIAPSIPSYAASNGLKVEIKSQECKTINLTKQ